MLFDQQLAIKSATSLFILLLEPSICSAFEQLFLSSLFSCLAYAPVLFMKMPMVGLWCDSYLKCHNYALKSS